MRFVLVFAALFACACTTPSPQPDAGSPPTSTDEAVAIGVRPTPPPDPPGGSGPTPEHRPLMVSDTRSAAQSAALGCTAADGSWRCKTPKPKTFMVSSGSPLIPPSWSVSTWYVDPSNTSGLASDSNSCTASTAPCLTYAEIMGHRWGTNAPNFQQCTTAINFMSDQASPWADPITIGNFYSSAACVAVDLVINGTLLSQTTGTIGTFTPRNRTAGTYNEITSTGGAAGYWAPHLNYLVNDTTAGAWFWVESDLGSDTALITEPFSSNVFYPTLASPFNTYTTIANGDAYTVYRPTLLNVISTTNVNRDSYVVFQHVQFTQPQGTFLGGNSFIIESASDSTTLFNTVNSEEEVFYNSYLGSQVILRSGTFLAGGAINTRPAQCAVFSSPDPINQIDLDGDIILDENSACGSGGLFPCNTGYVSIRRVGLRCAWVNDPGSNGIHPHTALTSSCYTGRAQYLWGPGSYGGAGPFTLFVAAFFGNTATSSMLLTNAGTFTSVYGMDGVYTGFPWDAGARVYTPPVTISGAAIDDAGGLFQPGTWQSSYQLY